MDLPTPRSKKVFWRRLETAAEGAPPARAVAMLRFNRAGLLPVVTQCAQSGKTLMLAWMNAAALKQTLASGHMTYYSRSRRRLWRKGETSGNIQILRALFADCDGDALLAQVEQKGAGACHTGRPGCFYVPLFGGKNGK